MCDQRLLTTSSSGISPPPSGDTEGCLKRAAKGGGIDSAIRHMLRHCCWMSTVLREVNRRTGKVSRRISVALGARRCLLLWIRQETSSDKRGHDFAAILRTCYGRPTAPSYLWPFHSVEGRRGRLHNTIRYRYIHSFCSHMTCLCNPLPAPLTATSRDSMPALPASHDMSPRLQKSILERITQSIHISCVHNL